MSCEASRWRVCYQQGLPRLVIGAMETFPVGLFVALVVLHVLFLQNIHLPLLLPILLLKSGSHHNGGFRINGLILGQEKIKCNEQHLKCLLPVTIAFYISV